MQEDDVELNSFESSGERQNIRTIGSALVGEEQEEVNTMSDNGSTGTLITHSQARKSRLKKKRITNLKIKTLTGFKKLQDLHICVAFVEFQEKEDTKDRSYWSDTNKKMQTIVCQE